MADSEQQVREVQSIRGSTSVQRRFDLRILELDSAGAARNTGPLP